MLLHFELPPPTDTYLQTLSHVLFGILFDIHISRVRSDMSFCILSIWHIIWHYIWQSVRARRGWQNLQTLTWLQNRIEQVHDMNSKLGTCRPRFLDLTFHAAGFPCRWAVQLYRRRYRRIVFDPAGGFVIRQFPVRCWQPWWRHQWLLRNSGMADEWATGRVFNRGSSTASSTNRKNCGRHLSDVDRDRERLSMRCQKRAQKPSCIHFLSRTD